MCFASERCCRIGSLDPFPTRRSSDLRRLRWRWRRRLLIPGKPLPFQVRCNIASGGAPPSIEPPEVSHAKRSEEHTSELQSRQYLVCRLLLEKKKSPSTWQRSGS